MTTRLPNAFSEDSNKYSFATKRIVAFANNSIASNSCENESISNEIISEQIRKTVYCSIADKSKLCTTQC